MQHAPSSVVCIGEGNPDIYQKPRINHSVRFATIAIPHVETGDRTQVAAVERQMCFKSTYLTRQPFHLNIPPPQSCITFRKVIKEKCSQDFQDFIGLLLRQQHYLVYNRFTIAWIKCQEPYQTRLIQKSMH